MFGDPPGQGTQSSVMALLRLMEARWMTDCSKAQRSLAKLDAM
jgi:hypothetical protein